MKPKRHHNRVIRAEQAFERGRRDARSGKASRNAPPYSDPQMADAWVKGLDRERKEAGR